MLGQTHRGRAEIRTILRGVLRGRRGTPHGSRWSSSRWASGSSFQSGCTAACGTQGITDEMIPTERVHAFAVRDGQIVWNYICADKDEAIRSGQIARISRPEDGTRRSSKCCPLDSTRQKRQDQGDPVSFVATGGKTPPAGWSTPSRRPQARYCAGDVRGRSATCSIRWCCERPPSELRSRRASSGSSSARRSGGG